MKAIKKLIFETSKPKFRIFRLSGGYNITHYISAPRNYCDNI